MKVDLDISLDLIDQFNDYFKLQQEGEVWLMNPKVGKGGVIKHLKFPGSLELYHFGRTIYQIPIDMTSVNAPDTQWHVIHINLSQTKQEKYVNGEKIELQKHLPAGMLFYGPDLEIRTQFSEGSEAEVATLRFNTDFLQTYFNKDLNALGLNKSLSFETLDHKLERKFNRMLNSMDNKIKCHSLTLEFLTDYFEKISKHDRMESRKKIDPRDLKSLFMISSLLRDPLAHKIPPIEELAFQSGMGSTKFKSLFKQVFGKPPFEYRKKVRMEYAREQIQVNRKNPSEVSYELGYTHPTNFTIAYKKEFGVLPSEDSGDSV